MARLTPPAALGPAVVRETFDCGRNAMNLWFRNDALHAQQAGASRTSLISDATTGDIVGYVCLAAAFIERSPRGKVDQRRDPIPALLLSQIAVSLRYQGHGRARSLMWHVMKTAVQFAEDVGCFCLVLHPLDPDGAVRFFVNLALRICQATLCKPWPFVLSILNTTAFS